MPSDRRISVDPTRATSLARSLRQHLRPAVLSELVGILTNELPISPPRCTARSQSTGEPCGNDVDPAALVCRSHGGAARQVRLAAVDRAAYADALVNGPRRKPWEIYLEKLHRLDVDADRVMAEVLAKDSPTAQDYTNMVEAQLAALRAAKDAITTGLAERMVALSERDEARVYEVIVGTLADVDRPVDDAEVRAALYGRLRAIEGGEAA